MSQVGHRIGRRSRRRRFRHQPGARGNPGSHAPVSTSTPTCCRPPVAAFFVRLTQNTSSVANANGVAPLAQGWPRHECLPWAQRPSRTQPHRGCGPRGGRIRPGPLRRTARCRKKLNKMQQGRPGTPIAGGVSTQFEPVPNFSLRSPSTVGACPPRQSLSPALEFPKRPANPLPPSGRTFEPVPKPTPSAFAIRACPQAIPSASAAGACPYVQHDPDTPPKKTMRFILTILSSPHENRTHPANPVHPVRLQSHSSQTH